MAVFLETQAKKKTLKKSNLIRHVYRTMNTKKDSYSKGTIRQEYLL